jgi:sugar phosphate isomerase/epimerase
LKTGSATAVALGLAGTRLLADPLGLPAGLQLYSVRTLLPKDFAGTLKQVAAIGYREVEAAGFFNHSPEEAQQAMSAAGLSCVSAHYSLADLQNKTDTVLQYAKALGIKYLICPSPSVADPSKFASYPGGAWGYFHHGSTLEDWKWNAEQFNQVGKRLKSEGIRFGYHNHTPEFHDVGGGVLGYDVLLKETDPEYVTFELDCGWVQAAGQDPLAYLTKYPKRISMLHVKDQKALEPGQDPSKRVSTMLGKGTFDYKPIFAAAKKASIKHYFVEQEEFEGDPLQELAVDYNYLHAMK